MIERVLMVLAAGAVDDDGRRDGVLDGVLLLAIMIAVAIGVLVIGGGQ